MKNGKRFLGDPHKAKRKFKNYKDEKNKVIKDFWNKEYAENEDEEGKGGVNFNLSSSPSEDLLKFTRWLAREYKGQNILNKKTFVVDAGCGNGRNLFYLNEVFGVKGLGFDLSAVAIKKACAKRTPGLEFVAQNLNQKIPLPDGSVDLVIDAVASHVLRKSERDFFKSEVLRVLSSGSYYFLKSLLRDDDVHSKNMIREFGQSKSENVGEENSYIHPTIGIFEHVPSEDELLDFYKSDFDIDKIERSFAHKINGRAAKRRYIVMYLRKK